MRIATYILMALVAMSFISCATRRVSQSTDVVIDTLRVRMTDTVVNVIHRDTMIVSSREVITEHIVTRFDPSSGNPVEQDVQRAISRSMDSIVSHLLDSLYNARSDDMTSYHKDSISDLQDVEPVSNVETMRQKVLRYLRRLLSYLFTFTIGYVLGIVTIIKFKSKFNL